MEENKKTFKEKLIAFWSVKRNKIITCSLGGVLLVGIVLAIVLPIALAHTHTFAKTWDSDKTYHWHDATCGHDVVDGKAEHTFKEQAVAATYEEEGYTLHTCEVCGYSYKDNETTKLTHNYASTWSSDKDSHWHACTDEGYESLKKDEAEHTFKDDVVAPTKDKDGYTNHICTVCDYSYQDSEVPSIKKQQALGMIPVINNATNTITYGLHPQTRVSDDNTITALSALTSKEDNGWYLYNDEYYMSIAANPYHSFANFEDGTSIERGKTYWFKCEPINWNILKSSDGVYSLVSTVLIDTHIYDSDSNNYKDSEIKSWLNNEFLNTAFNLNSSYIETTEVNNSASTTKADPNDYACENTNDKIYLLSYKDYLNSSYGYSTSDGETVARQCKITDFANANGAYYSTSYSYSGFYWTRSPNTSGSNSVSYVYHDGSLTRNLFADYEGIGVRPAITINLH